jgi:hypothetical protein
VVISGVQRHVLNNEPQHWSILYNHNGGVHVVIDIAGYYQDPWSDDSARSVCALVVVTVVVVVLSLQMPFSEGTERSLQHTSKRAPVGQQVVDP